MPVSSAMHNAATASSDADDLNFRAVTLPVMRETRSSGSRTFQMCDHATRQMYARAVTYDVVCSALQWGTVLCVHRAAHFAVRSEEIKKREELDGKCWGHRVVLVRTLGPWRLLIVTKIFFHSATS